MNTRERFTYNGFEFAPIEQKTLRAQGAEYYAISYHEDLLLDETISPKFSSRAEAQRWADEWPAA